MAKSEANTVGEYLADLAEDRRAALTAVRKVILENLPVGYEETMQYGMVGYVIPLERYPATYNGKALIYTGLASQKNYMSVYLMGYYMDPDVQNKFEKAYAASGKRFDAGKSCIRFKKVDDLYFFVI